MAMLHVSTETANNRPSNIIFPVRYQHKRREDEQYETHIGRILSLIGLFWILRCLNSGTYVETVVYLRGGENI